MALNYQDSPQSNMLYGNQPLQGGVVYNQNPGWLATLLSGIKNVGSAVGQGALDAAPYFLSGNSNSLPTSVVQNNPFNASDTSTPNNPNNFKIQNARPYSSPLQQAYANLHTASSLKPQLVYATQNSPSVQRGLNGLVGVQMPPAEIGPQAYSNLGQNPLLALAPPLPSPGSVQQWSDAVPNMGMSSPERYQHQAGAPHYAGYPRHTVAMPVARIAQGDLLSEPYGYPRRGKQGESGAAYQMIQGTLPSDVQKAIYRRKAQILDKIAKAKEAVRIRKLKAYYGDNLPGPGAIDWRNIIPPDNAVFHKQYAQTIQWERTHPKLAGFLNGLFNLPYADPKPKTKYEAEQKAFGEAEGRVLRQKLNLDPED